MKVLTEKLSIGVMVIAIIFSFRPSVQAADIKKIRLGCAISFTGSKSRSGNLYRNAYDMAVETINKNGGVKVGDDTYHFEIVYYDDKSDSAESAKLVEKLITEDKVHFLLGPYSSGITITDSQVAQRYSIPMIAGGGASDTIFSKGNKYIFGTLPPAGQYFKSTLEMLLTFKPIPRTVAVLYSDDKFDVSVSEGTWKLAKVMGFNVALFEKYSEHATDFTSVLTKVKTMNVDVVLLAGHTEESLSFAKQARELDVCPKMISMTVGPAETAFRRSLGKNAEYIYGVASWSAHMNFTGFLYKDTQEFVRLFQDEFNYAPDYHNAAGIAVIAVFKDAIQRAGSLNPIKVRDAIAATALDTVYGHVEFSEDGQIKGNSVVLQILDGEIYQVFPNSIRHPAFPVPSWTDRL